MAYHRVTPVIYEKLIEGFTLFPENYTRAADHAGVDWRLSKRWYHGGARPLPDGMRPIKEVIAEREALRLRAKADQEAALAAERERISLETDEARKLELEAKQIDETSMRALRKTTLAGLAACAGLTDGITQLAKRIGNQLANGVDAKGNALDIDVGKALRTMRDYSLTVGRLGQVVDTIASMERVRMNLPTAIVGLDVSHVTLEDAEREVEFAKTALSRAKELGLVVVDGGVNATGTGK